MFEIDWEEYHRAKILKVVFHNCTEVELNEGISEADKVIESGPEQSVLIYSEYNNLKVSIESLRILKESSRKHSPYVIASAVKCSGLLKQITKAVISFSGRKNINVFDKEDLAKAWLAEQKMKAAAAEARAN